MADVYHLHEHILFEILIRMPTKPMLRFRCLSKHWNRLISDHFSKSRSPRMILLPFEPLQAIDNTVPSDRNVCFVSELPSSFTTTGSKYHVIIAGTVNGIVLLVLKEDMVLYNPFTGGFKIVPNPPLNSSYRPSDAYGFCHGTTADDIKIVRIRHDGNGFYQAFRWCDVFSLKMGLWSTNSGTLFGRCFIKQRAGTFLNGFLYWIAVKENMSFIVSLNVKEMIFSEIQLPFLGGCLGTSSCGRLQVFRVASTKFELWVMNENIVKKSWSRVLISNGLPSVHPLWILDEGKIVMLVNEDRRQVIIYDMLKDSFDVYDVNATQLSNFSTRGLQAMQLRSFSIWGLQAVEYVESLISPSHLCSTW